MKNLFILTCSLAFAQIASAQVPTIKKYNVIKTSETMVIDGVLNEASWTSTSFVETLTNMDGTAAFQKTDAKILWSDNYLYFAFVVEDTSMWSTLATKDGALWNQDVMEILIDYNGDGLQYSEMGISPNNTWYDLQMTKPYSQGGTYNLNWNISGLQSMVTQVGTVNTVNGGVKWVCEIAIPFAGVPVSPASIPAPNIGDKWRLNIARADHNFNATNSLKLYTWSYTDGLTNHLPSRFGEVTFLGYSSTEVDEHTLSAMVNVFPIPASNYCSISINSELSSNVEIAFYNQIGQKVYSEIKLLQAGNNQFTLDVSDLSKGLYYCSVIMNESQHTVKLILH